MGICRHINWRPLDDGRYKECTECGVWYGNRTDPHHYAYDYYYRNNTVVNGIPQREWYWGIHKVIWDGMGIDFSGKKQKILEFGCGIGSLLWTIYRNYGFNCIGLESSYWAWEWQKEARGFSEDYLIINNDFETQSVKYLKECGEPEYQGREYDFVFSCHVMEHLQDPMAAIEKCYELLKLNGYFYMAVPDKEHQRSLHVHTWTYDENVLMLWLTQVGFVDIQVKKTKPYNPPPIKGEYPGHYLHVCGRKV